MKIKTGFAIALLSFSLLSAGAARAFDPVAGVIVGATIGAAIASDVHHRAYYPPPGYGYAPEYYYPPVPAPVYYPAPFYYPAPVYVRPHYYRHGGYRYHHRGGYNYHQGGRHHRR
ncbi:MAG: hypothetical protein H6R18_2735 [Proteobacteria bacterium]|nr:hypothetical protein [Pseudomonadota bacterium]